MHNEDYIALIGKRFGKLMFTSLSKDKWGGVMANYECDCGKSGAVYAGAQLMRRDNSCGCGVYDEEVWSRSQKTNCVHYRISNSSPCGVFRLSKQKYEDFTTKDIRKVTCIRCRRNFDSAMRSEVSLAIWNNEYSGDLPIESRLYPIYGPFVDRINGYYELSDAQAAAILRQKKTGTLPLKDIPKSMIDAVKAQNRLKFYLKKGKKNGNQKC